jgi:hypothetical protein
VEGTERQGSFAGKPAEIGGLGGLTREAQHGVKRGQPLIMKETRRFRGREGWGLSR